MAFDLTPYGGNQGITVTLDLSLFLVPFVSSLLAAPSLPAFLALRVSLASNDVVTGQTYTSCECLCAYVFV